MLKSDQRKIVNAMIRTQAAEMREKLKRVPAHWDGIELREMFADEANSFRCGTGAFDRRRKKKYFSDRYSGNF